MTCEACGKSHGGVNERIECLTVALRSEVAQSRMLRERVAKLTTAIKRAQLAIDT